MRELFGGDYDAWKEAFRTQGARWTVGELVQQTFQSAGPIDNSQAEALTAIVARHPLSGSGTGYDWNGIATEAAGLFTGPQLEAFNQAARLRSLSDQMAAIAIKRR